MRKIGWAQVWAVFLAVALLPWAAPAAGADKTRPVEWYTVIDAVEKELHRRDVLEWSDELAGQLDKADPATLITAAEVFLRAGQPERISTVIGKLGAVQARFSSVSGWPDCLLKRKYYPQARAWFDTFENCHAHDKGMRAFFGNWEATNKKEDLEAWLAAKAEKDTQRWFWPRHYYQYLQRHGKLDKHLTMLERKIRKDPTRYLPMQRYLRARSEVVGRKPRPSIRWLGEIARPQHAIDAFQLARTMRSDEHHKAAIRLFEHSLTRKVTDYDHEAIRHFCARAFAPEEVEGVLRQWAKVGVADACFRAGQLDRAQKLIEALTGKKDGTLGDLSHLRLAGQVQRQSGKRVVEGRIKKAEKANEKSVPYWLGRTKYYLGRQEHDQVVAAYEKALALPPDQHRFGVVRDYGWYLACRDRHGKAEALFRGELKRIGVRDQGAGFWIQQLKNLDRKGGVKLAWNDPVLWEWLAFRKTYGFGQSAQWDLEWAAGKAGAQRAEFKRKALALADAKSPPPLRFALGKILHGQDPSPVNLAMMESAFAQWPRHGYPPRDHVGEHLMSIYLARGEWRKAEKVFQTVSERLASGRRGWLRRLAVAAAKAGDKTDAMRFWARRAGQDLTDREGLGELASHGMTDRLTAYYKALARRAPKNAAVAAALKELER